MCLVFYFYLMRSHDYVRIPHDAAGNSGLVAILCIRTSLVPRPSASRARIAYVTFEPLSDSWHQVAVFVVSI